MFLPETKQNKSFEDAFKKKVEKEIVCKLPSIVLEINRIIEEEEVFSDTIALDDLIDQDVPIPSIEIDIQRVKTNGLFLPNGTISINRGIKARIQILKPIIQTMAFHVADADYRETLKQLDSRNFVNFKMTLIEIRNQYALLNDIIKKNKDKIKKPRTSHADTIQCNAPNNCRCKLNTRVSTDEQFFNLICSGINFTQFDIKDWILTLPSNTFSLKIQVSELPILLNDSFQSLKKLKKLQISHSQISQIQQHAFRGLDRLRKLTLNNNNITRVFAQKWLDDLRGLRILDLSNNQYIICDCAIVPLLEWSDLPKNLVTADCGQPNELEAYDFSKLHNLQFQCKRETDSMEQYSLPNDNFDYQDYYGDRINTTSLESFSNSPFNENGLIESDVFNFNENDRLDEETIYIYDKKLLEIESLEMSPIEDQWVKMGDSITLKCRMNLRIMPKSINLNDISVDYNNETNLEDGIIWFNQDIDVDFPTKKLVVNGDLYGHVNIENELKQYESGYIITSELHLMDIPLNLQTDQWICRDKHNTIEQQVNILLNDAISPSTCGVTLKETLVGSFHLPETNVGESIFLKCRNNELLTRKAHIDDQSRLAKFKCDSTGEWLVRDLSNCTFDNQVTQLLYQYSTSDPINEKNFFIRFAEITSLVPTIDRLKSSDDIVFISYIIERVANITHTLTLQSQLVMRLQMVESIFRIISFIMNANRDLLLESEYSSGAMSRMMKSFRQSIITILNGLGDIVFRTDNVILHATDKLVLNSDQVWKCIPQFENESNANSSSSSSEYDNNKHCEVVKIDSIGPNKSDLETCFISSESCLKKNICPPITVIVLVFKNSKAFPSILSQKPNILGLNNVWYIGTEKYNYEAPLHSIEKRDSFEDYYDTFDDNDSYDMYYLSDGDNTELSIFLQPANNTDVDYIGWSEYDAEWSAFDGEYRDENSNFISTTQNVAYFTAISQKIANILKKPVVAANNSKNVNVYFDQSPHVDTTFILRSYIFYSGSAILVLTCIFISVSYAVKYRCIRMHKNLKHCLIHFNMSLMCVSLVWTIFNPKNEFFNVGYLFYALSVIFHLLLLTYLSWKFSYIISFLKMFHSGPSDENSDDSSETPIKSTPGKQNYTLSVLYFIGIFCPLFITGVCVGANFTHYNMLGDEYLFANLTLKKSFIITIFPILSYLLFTILLCVFAIISITCKYSSYYSKILSRKKRFNSFIQHNTSNKTKLRKFDSEQISTMNHTDRVPSYQSNMGYIRSSFSNCPKLTWNQKFSIKFMELFEEQDVDYSTRFHAIVFFFSTLLDIVLLVSVALTTLRPQVFVSKSSRIYDYIYFGACICISLLNILYYIIFRSDVSYALLNCSKNNSTHKITNKSKIFKKPSLIYEDNRKYHYNINSKNGNPRNSLKNKRRLENLSGRSSVNSYHMMDGPFETKNIYGQTCYTDAKRNCNYVSNMQPICEVNASDTSEDSDGKTNEPRQLRESDICIMDYDKTNSKEENYYKNYVNSNTGTVKDIALISHEKSPLLREAINRNTENSRKRYWPNLNNPIQQLTMDYQHYRNSPNPERIPARIERHDIQDTHLSRDNFNQEGDYGIQFLSNYSPPQEIQQTPENLTVDKPDSNHVSFHYGYKYYNNASNVQVDQAVDKYNDEVTNLYYNNSDVKPNNLYSSRPTYSSFTLSKLQSKISPFINSENNFQTLNRDVNRIESKPGSSKRNFDPNYGFFRKNSFQDTNKETNI
ncbi:hypothetical protein A3Q56_02250 [Intoshia linei]|uniref:Proteasome activator PA28 C-terminal domain-containing protein n=1 Tax=Intoshia linei TaxID=1819745 RepID=A0A177B6T5_9BILA|nr:hypothetical protein A3Q56_02250 [Intoshia linei]